MLLKSQQYLALTVCDPLSSGTENSISFEQRLHTGHVILLSTIQ